MTYISVTVTALTLESGRSTFIKHRLWAVSTGSFSVFGLVKGWVVSTYSDGSFGPIPPPPPHTHTHTLFYITSDDGLFYEVSY